eukprot:UN28757
MKRAKSFTNQEYSRMWQKTESNKSQQTHRKLVSCPSNSELSSAALIPFTPKEKSSDVKQGNDSRLKYDVIVKPSPSQGSSGGGSEAVQHITNKKQHQQIIAQLKTTRSYNEVVKNDTKFIQELLDLDEKRNLDDIIQTP